MQPIRHTRERDRVLAELFRRQHGVMGQDGLMAAGLGRGAIRHRVDRGRMHVVHPRVYSDMHPALLSPRGRWMAAVLAGGRGAVLSHRSAAALWGLIPNGTGPVDVTVPRQHRPREGIRFHRSPLPHDEIAVHDGVPVTSVPRTLLDLAALLTPRRTERALNEAEVLRLWDSLSLDDLLNRYPRRAGTPNLRAALASRRSGATATRSELEERFIELIDASGLPRPEVNVTLALPGRRLEVDCLWRQQRLVVELDSRAFHNTVAAFEQDRERDRALHAAGWDVIRVTWRQLNEGRQGLIADFDRLLAAAPTVRLPA